MFFNKIAKFILNLFYSNPNTNYKTCRRCKAPLSINVTICPNCGLHQVLPVNLALVIWVLTIFVVFASYLFIPKMLTSEPPVILQPQIINKDMLRSIKQDSRGINIPIKPMIELSGLSVDEILKIRKNAVTETIALGDVSKYQPSPDVFSIESGLPWMGAYESSCKGVDNNPNIGKGVSRESVGILNPELLYYVIIPSFEDRSKCSSADYLIPYKLVYDEIRNTLVAYINYTSFYKVRGNFLIHLSDTNARDFGYNWALADKTRNIHFQSNENFSTRVSQTRGYWHRGYACGLSSGCNNYSPMNEDIIFAPTALPAAINIKLWKKEPKSAERKADINYMMVFE